MTVPKWKDCELVAGIVAHKADTRGSVMYVLSDVHATSIWVVLALSTGPDRPVGLSHWRSEDDDALAVRAPTSEAACDE